VLAPVKPTFNKTSPFAVNRNSFSISARLHDGGFSIFKNDAKLGVQLRLKSKNFHQCKKGEYLDKHRREGGHCSFANGTLNSTI